MEELRDEVLVVASIYRLISSTFIAALEVLVVFMLRVDKNEAKVVMDRLHSVETKTGAA